MRALASLLFTIHSTESPKNPKGDTLHVRQYMFNVVKSLT
jgi:hypothetical protein